MPSSGSTGTMSNIVSGLDTFLTTVLPVGQRWTKVGSTYTSPLVNGRQMSFTLAQVGTSLSFTLAGAPNKTLYAHSGSVDAAGSGHQAYLYGSDRHFFMTLTGPPSSTQGAGYPPNGSIRQCFGLFHLDPYHPQDTVLSTLWVAVGNSSPSSVSLNEASVFVNQGANAASWASARLATLRPAIAESPTTAGRLLKRTTAFGQLVTLPFVVVEDVGGIRGRLRDVVFINDMIAGSADTATPDTLNQDVYVDGVTHRACTPWGAAMSDVYSPFGRTFQTAAQNTGEGGVGSGGPLIAVRI